MTERAEIFLHNWFPTHMLETNGDLSNVELPKEYMQTVLGFLRATS